MSSIQIEQCVNVKFLVMLGKTALKTFTMLKEVYRDELCKSRTQVYEWFKMFKEGRETTEDDPHSG